MFPDCGTDLAIFSAVKMKISFYIYPWNLNKMI